MTKDKSTGNFIGQSIALKMALEVLQINLKLLKKVIPHKGQEHLLSDSIDLTHKATTAIKQALAAPHHRAPE
jgi:hypothetical protein